MAILVNNIQEIVPIEEEWLHLLENVLQSGLDTHGKENSEVSVILVDNQYIQELNQQYRGLDQPTDVLSFAMEEDPVEGVDVLPEDAPELLGDIFISMERAVEQAKEYDHSLIREVNYLAIHGLLHLLGFDHQTPEDTNEMRAEEEKILAAYKIGRNHE
ncbi:MAG TPA: rRNA maturation RNase YbeY [Firmicutes bacterium]|nr:rRNA maturation RNase YbeY [Bacillota bacterium]